MERDNGNNSPEIPKPTPTLKDVFTGMIEMEAEYPRARHSIAWQIEKVREESDELYLEMTNEPNEEEWLAMVKENTDVFISTLGVFKSLGVSPEEALDFALAKLTEVRQRWATGYYDRIPTLKPRSTTVYSSLEDDYLGSSD